MGDLNIHVNNLEDPDNILLQNWLKAFGMINHVTFPTHTSGNTLDLVLSKHKQQLQILSVQPGLSVSDHTKVFVHVDMVKPALTRSVISVRRLNTMQLEDFSAELGKLQAKLEVIYDPDHLASQYSKGLAEILDNLAPSKKVMTTKLPQFPWYDNKSSQLKRAVRLLERRWRHCKTSQTREDYTRLRNVYARHLCYNKRKIIS